PSLAPHRDPHSFPTRRSSDLGNRHHAYIHPPTLHDGFMPDIGPGIVAFVDINRLNVLVHFRIIIFHTDIEFLSATGMDDHPVKERTPNNILSRGGFHRDRKSTRLNSSH